MIHLPHHPANQRHGIHFGALRPPQIPSNDLAAANRDLNAACSCNFLSINPATFPTDGITLRERPAILQSSGHLQSCGVSGSRLRNRGSRPKTSHFTACKPGRTTRSLTRAAVECATCQREPVDLCHGLFDGLLHGILWLAGTWATIWTALAHCLK
ncbi:hypothetical protein ASPVEDRAFT_449803 [Aspergillus versicolor CBS 583.65]|uniref:Uncharacterized protein n=1 Tax=Aspergillus versicolor CBS 583.65 TaxID=1036611 RepID=A0A1L9P9R7_ASPVE|nr:uncharacterized protein ASPVEDRAFT_449803 [Aspergillus versicolor CBS 583.65]OJI98212.1 hypothetical protein ASPVEDRAFT_449803 [Aspergillus versicolor CBS 583.65]